MSETRNSSVDSSKSIRSVCSSDIEESSCVDSESDNEIIRPRRWIKRRVVCDVSDEESESDNSDSKVVRPVVSKTRLEKYKRATFNNEFVLFKLNENTMNVNVNNIRELKKVTPLLSDLEILEFYNKSISIHQSQKQKNGHFLENIIKLVLDEHNVIYKEQVVIDNFGKIVGFNKKTKLCFHVIDFVIGENINIGSSVKNNKIISCKTTCRERWTQDDWTFVFPPKLYILVTISNDYPLSKRFRESSFRKIITCNPRKKDDRIFKLEFDHLISELKHF
jgi:hypothetical protein